MLTCRQSEISYGHFGSTGTFWKLLEYNKYQPIKAKGVHQARQNERKI